MFPSEDPDLYYVPASINESGQAVGARGCLYNYYKEVRGDLRLSGLDTRMKKKDLSAIDNETDGKTKVKKIF